ncbi:MAG: ECF transporter S component [Eubacterium sp.]|nr:ECF transporter S component [Eubacterium sp.]
MNEKLRKSIVSGVFAAMIFVLTMFVKFPVGPGYIHFADSLVYVCSALIGPFGILAGAIGEGLADAVGGFAVYVPFTVVIKIIIALPFALSSYKEEKILTVKNILFSVLALFVSTAGYIVADRVVAGQGFAFTYMWINIVQGIASSFVFAIIAAAFDRINIRKKLF